MDCHHVSSTHSANTSGRICTVRQLTRVAHSTIVCVFNSGHRYGRRALIRERAGDNMYWGFGSRCGEGGEEKRRKENGRDVEMHCSSRGREDLSLRNGICSPLQPYPYIGRPGARQMPSLSIGENRPYSASKSATRISYPLTYHNVHDVCDGGLPDGQVEYKESVQELWVTYVGRDFRPTLIVARQAYVYGGKPLRSMNAHSSLLT